MRSVLPPFSLLLHRHVFILDWVEVERADR